MEKDKRRKKVDDTKPDAEDVIDELLEGVDLKQGAPEEADSKYLYQIMASHQLIQFLLWRGKFGQKVFTTNSQIHNHKYSRIHPQTNWAQMMGGLDGTQIE